MTLCTTCGTSIFKGLYCKKCIGKHRRELAAARRKCPEYMHSYYMRRKEKEQRKLSLHLRPCQSSVDELNENFPWLKKVDHPWR